MLNPNFSDVALFKNVYEIMLEMTSVSPLFHRTQCQKPVSLSLLSLQMARQGKFVNITGSDHLS